MKKLFFCIFWLAALALMAAKYPPGLHWREIDRGPLTIIFPERYGPQAETALAAAEKAYEKLAAFWGFRPAGRIRIVLNDSSDEANGFATVFPFHLVGINLFEPAPDSTLACSQDWFDLVIGHELTHIFTLDKASEPFRVLRHVLGSYPALFPAAQLPPWVIEGLAVYCESALSGDGRLNHAPYRLMLDAARRDGFFPGWSPVAGTPAAWPGASAKYLYGAGFMDYLASAYGSDSLPRYLESATRLPFQFSSSWDFEMIFGKKLDELWQEYRDMPLATGSTEAEGCSREPCINKGFSNQYPCPLPGNKLAYYHRDFRGQGTVEVMEMKSGLLQALFKMDGVNGLSHAGSENKLFLSASEYFRGFSEFSDLYEYDLNLRSVHRLSHGQRLSQPLKKANANELYCVQRRDSRFYLALFDQSTQKVRTLSRAFTGLSQLSLSPDQRFIAAAVKTEGCPWVIAVFSGAGELRTRITLAGTDCRQPVWLNDNTLYFIQADASHTRLARVAPDGNHGGISSDPRLSGLQQFALDDDSQSMYFTYFSGRGLEVARLSLAELTFASQKFDSMASRPETTASAPEFSRRTYRFWRDLLPHYWGPSVRVSGDEYQAGIMTTGQDALAIHSYSVEGYFGFSSLRPCIMLRYEYDGLQPTVSLSYSDSSGFYRDLEDGASRRSQELKIESLWPLRVRKTSQLKAYVDLHLERRSVISAAGSQENTGSYNGFRLGLDFNSTHEYYDSVSQADGMCFTLQYAIQPAALDNEFASRSAQADLRQYISVFRPGVLAWRLAWAKSWNAGADFYALGGIEGEGGRSLGQSRPFDLLRAFPAGFQSGDRGWQFNLEYRLPLFKIEKAFLPAFSLDRVYLIAFCDMGRLWQGSAALPTAYSGGGEAVLRLAIGGSETFDLAGGLAYGFGPERKLYFYTRLGRSF